MTKLKTTLGRGLDVLLSAPTNNVDQLQVLNISSIRPGKYQPRSFMDPEALNELAASIQAQGLIQPVIVREVGFGSYELIAGERRWRASQIAGLKKISAVIRSVEDEATLAMSIIENIQRQDLNPLEEAHGLARLAAEFGLTHEKIAQAVGKSRSAVTNLLRLTQLPEPVQLLMFEGLLDVGHARALLMLPTLLQLEWANKIVQEGWSVRETEAALSRYKEIEVAGGDTQSKAPKKIDPNVEALQNRLAGQLGAKVELKHLASGKGKISISYHDLDELERLLSHFGA